MAIRITTEPTHDDLFGQSHFWGFPDLPLGMSYPCCGEADEEGREDTLTFICQIRLEEIAALDPEGLLPHKGMLYFFADIDYFLGDDEGDCEGMGAWPKESFRVLYAPDCSDLHTHEVYYEDGSPATLPVERITFSEVEEKADGQKLLGRPYFDEVEWECEGMLSLLQLDEEDRWNLRFFDSGMLHFLIRPGNLRNRRFDRVKVWMHSF